MCYVTKIVKLCVNFVSVYLKVQKWTQTDTKVTLHPPPPPGNFYWCQMKGMANIRLFYSCAMVLILPWLKDIAHFVFYDCNIRRHRFSLCDLSQLSVYLSFCLSVLLSFLLSVLLSICWYVCPSYCQAALLSVFPYQKTFLVTN